MPTEGIRQSTKYFDRDLLIVRRKGVRWLPSAPDRLRDHEVIALGNLGKYSFDGVRRRGLRRLELA